MEKTGFIRDSNRYVLYDTKIIKTNKIYNTVRVGKKILFASECFLNRGKFFEEDFSSSKLPTPPNQNVSPGVRCFKTDSMHVIL